MSDALIMGEDAAQTPPPPTKDRRKVWLIAGSAAVGVLLIAYLLAALLLQDRIPRDTSVLGVEVGGMSPSAATEHLEKELEPLTTEPFTVAANDAQADIDPGEAGLHFDAPATVDDLVGFTLSPGRLWAHVVGGGEAAPIIEVDDAALKRAVAGLAPSFAIEAVDGTIQFVDGNIETTASEEGSEVDVPAAVQLVADEWLPGERPLALPVVSAPPNITDAEVDRAVTEDAEPLIAAPIEVNVSSEVATLTPELLAAAGSFTAKGSLLVLDLDGAALAADIRAQLPAVESAPVDAHITLVDGAVSITPSTPGVAVDEILLADSVLAASHTPERATDAEFKDVEAALTTAAAEGLGVKEQISTFATYVTSDYVRTENLRNGASKINNALVLPGETFSLLEALEPIDAENGFGNAGILVEGVLTEGMGGGLSQLATTLYNAVFFSGLEDVEHTPHSQYFDRYPEVRESTIFVPSIDVKFRNDSDYGVLIQAWVSDSQIHVSFWSTKVWDIEAVNSGRSQIVQPKTVKSTYKDCRPSGNGNPGFLATVDRLFYQNGELVKTESYTWRYEPQNGIECA